MGLFPMAESRPPPTPLITTTDSSLRSPTREPQSTPQSPRRDTAMPPPTRLPLMPQPLLTSPLHILNFYVLHDSSLPILHHHLSFLPFFQHQSSFLPFFQHQF